MNNNTAATRNQPTNEMVLTRSRINLLFVVILTLINLISLMTGSDTFFLFSASVPYYLLMIAKVFSGHMPAEYYEGDEIAVNDGMYYGAMVIAFIFIALYLVFWFLSKKKAVWLKAALVMFVIDTVVLLAMLIWLGFAVSDILDIVFHGLVIFYLITGIKAHKLISQSAENGGETVADYSANNPANVDDKASKPEGDNYDYGTKYDTSENGDGIIKHDDRPEN